MIHLIFAGRLTHEKWFDLVLDFCDDVQWSIWEDSIHLHIFGDWEKKQELKKYPFLSYYWQQPKEKVMDVWKTCSYSLMPSRFLETFGLSALDSLSLWVPVIGFKKWWLEQFDEGIIDIPNSEQFTNTVFDALKKVDSPEYDKLSKICNDTSRQYTWEAWKIRFEDILWKKVIWSKILFASDYSWRIWWIESYITLVSEKLKGWGTSIISHVWAFNGSEWFLRYLLLPFSVRNVKVKNLIKDLVLKDTYDLVWWHSIQRWIGPYPISWTWKNIDVKQILMTHDFGLYHPFPSHIYSEDDLLSSLQFWERMKAGFKRFWTKIFLKIVRFIPLFFKWCSSKILIWVISKHIDLVLVPSEYMIKHIQIHYPNTNVQVLSHAL